MSTSAPRPATTGMPIGILPRICVVYELRPQAGDTPGANWRAAYFGDRNQATPLLVQFQGNRDVLQYEVFRLEYRSDGGARRPGAMTGGAPGRRNTPHHPRAVLP